MKHLRQLLLLPDCLLAEEVVADERGVVRVDTDADAKYEEEVTIHLLFCLDGGLAATLAHTLILTLAGIGCHFGGQEHRYAREGHDEEDVEAEVCQEDQRRRYCYPEHHLVC